MRIKKIGLLVSVLIMAALVIAACQAGAVEEQATEAAATVPNSAVETEAPAETSTPPAETAEPAINEVITAALSELVGLVTMKQTGDDSFVEASPDFVLQVNGQVQTGDDGKVRLDLSAGRSCVFRHLRCSHWFPTKSRRTACSLRPSLNWDGFS